MRPVSFCGKTSGKKTGITRMYQLYGRGLLRVDKNKGGTETGREHTYFRVCNKEEKEELKWV
jgi:hypothetical protein